MLGTFWNFFNLFKFKTFLKSGFIARADMACVLACHKVVSYVRVMWPRYVHIISD